MQCRGEGDETKIKCKFRKAAIHISVFFCCDNWRIKFIIIFYKFLLPLCRIAKGKVVVEGSPIYLSEVQRELLGRGASSSVAGGRRLGRHGFYLKMLMMMVDCCVCMCGGYNKLPSPSDV